MKIQTDKKTTHYSINQSLCTFCAGCASVCPVMAIDVGEGESRITGACIGCGNCAAFCPIDAVEEEE
jgi:formate hydrogenlyase subunit 6/NADH:ubiquinone oxidoreductase subunit I